MKCFDFKFNKNKTTSNNILNTIHDDVNLIFSDSSDDSIIVPILLAECENSDDDLDDLNYFFIEYNNKCLLEKCFNQLKNNILLKKKSRTICNVLKKMHIKKIIFLYISICYF